MGRMAIGHNRGKLLFPTLRLRYGVNLPQNGDCARAAGPGVWHNLIAEGTGVLALYLYPIHVWVWSPRTGSGSSNLHRGLSAAGREVFAGGRYRAPA